MPLFFLRLRPQKLEKNTTMKKIPSNPSEQPRAFCPLKNLQKSKGSGATESTSSIKPQQLQRPPAVDPSSWSLQTTAEQPGTAWMFSTFLGVNDLNDLKLTWKYDLYWNCIACGVTVDHPLAPKGVVEVDNQRKIAHRLVLTMSIDTLHTFKNIFSAWNK